MKLATLLPLCLAATVLGVNDQQAPLGTLPDAVPDAPERFLIELSPGKTMWVEEDDKWELKRVSSM